MPWKPGLLVCLKRSHSTICARGNTRHEVPFQVAVAGIYVGAPCPALGDVARTGAQEPPCSAHTLW